MSDQWHKRWDPAVLAGLGGLHVLLSLVLLPSGLLQKYPSFARLALAGQLSGEAASPASPLYLLIHVALPSGAVRWAQCAGALGCMLLLYRMGRSLLDPLGGLMAAGLFALTATVLVYGATFEPDFFLMAVCLLGVYAVSRAQMKLPRACLFGCAMGLAISLRPTSLLIAVTLLAGLGIGAVRRGTLRASLRPLGLAVVIMGLVGAAPLLVLQGLYSSPARGSMSPGTAFYDGNRPESIGLGITNPWLVKAVERQDGPREPLPDFAHAVYRRFARLDGGEDMTLAQIQNYWAVKSWAFARLEPGAFASGLVRKVLFLSAGTEYHDIHEVRRELVSLSRLPLLRHRWVFVLGLAGLLLAAWRRRMPWWLWGYWGAGMAGLIVFSVTTRYGMLFFPAVLLFAAFLLREALSVRRWTPAAGILACFGLALLPGLSPPVRWDARVQQRVLRAHQHVEELARQRRDLGAAMTAYVAGQAYFPFLPDVMDPRGLPFESRRLAREAAGLSELRGGGSPADAYLQAVLWKQAGDCGRAISSARRAAEAGFHTVDDSRLLDPHLLIAECLIADGRREEAMAEVLASLESRPATADGLAMALAGARSTGSWEARVPIWEDRLHSIHDPFSAAFALLRAYRTWGETAHAFETARSLMSRLPGAAVVEYELALLLAESGADEQAFLALQRARMLDPGLPLELSPFDDALHRLMVSDPGNRDVWVAKIDQAAQAGRFREAHEVAENAAARFEEDGEIRQLEVMMRQLADFLGDLV